MKNHYRYECPGCGETKLISKTAKGGIKVCGCGKKHEVLIVNNSVFVDHVENS